MFIANFRLGRLTEPMRFNSMKKIGGSILGLLLFLGIIVMSSTTAQAQYPWYQNQDQYRRQREYERERERQLRRQREQQARQGGWYDQYGNYHPANTQSGYYDQYGNFHPYNQGGYSNQGYYRGRSYDNYPNYGGSYNFRQTALNAGYNAGIKAGRDDRRSGRYNPYGHSEYRNASKDYNSREGDRGTYAQYFRQAFETGYRDGYNGY